MADYPKGWEEIEGSLVKTFALENFKKAILFINKIVPIAEEMNHHPDIDLFAYKNVKIKLKTHSKNAITRKDILLAKKIDEIS